MKATERETGSSLDWLKWAVVAAVIAGAVWGNVQYQSTALIYRAIALTIAAALGLAVASQTAQGAAFIELARAARSEIRKVVWPTRQEATQTTLVVVVVVLIMSLLLWGLDTFLGWLASKLIG
jgi:preprotein translocase subunit SecE